MEKFILSEAHKQRRAEKKHLLLSATGVSILTVTDIVLYIAVLDVNKAINTGRIAEIGSTCGKRADIGGADLES